MFDAEDKPITSVADFVGLTPVRPDQTGGDQLLAESLPAPPSGGAAPGPAIGTSSPMGREMKLGVAVIALLLCTFGGLLIHRLLGAASSARDDRTPVAVVAPTSHAENPTRILARRDRPRAEPAAGDPWSQRERDDRPTAAARDEVPPRNFMPAERTAFDRGADDIPDQNEEPTPASGNPFRSRYELADEDATARPLPQEPLDDAPLARPSRTDLAPLDPPRHEEPLTPARSERNPIRRLSAEEPLDAPSDFAAEVTPSWATRDEAETPELPRRPVPPRPDPVSRPVAEERIADARDFNAQRNRWPASDDRPMDRSAPAAPPADGKYTVGPNDSLWTISEKVYGTGGYFKAIAEYNKFNLPNPNRLQVGATIAVPPASVLEQKYPSLVPKQRKSALVEPRTIAASTRGRLARGENVYVVQQGDTLFDIARYELGKASRWGEIYELNRDILSQDFDYLQPGTQLAMPPRKPADNMTRTPEAGWQR